MSHLAKIIDYKKKEVEEEKKRGIVESEFTPRKVFKKSLLSFGISLIAEIKKASPSEGIIRKQFSPRNIAKIYEEEGVSAISVLTDKKFFQGHLSHLKVVRNTTSLPLLRKDFIIDEFQIYQSAGAGADAILLISSILSSKQLKSFLRIAKRAGLDCLCEVHTREDIYKTLKADAEIIGINNRDLNTFKVDITTTENLIKFIPRDIIVVSESGIKNKKDMERLRNWGVKAALIGTSLMRGNIRENIRKLRRI